MCGDGTRNYEERSITFRFNAPLHCPNDAVTIQCAGRDRGEYGTLASCARHIRKRDRRRATGSPVRSVNGAGITGLTFAGNDSAGGDNACGRCVARAARRSGLIATRVRTAQGKSC